MDELLQILSRDARIPIPDLAAMTGRSEDDVRAAIAEYERRGTILRYRAVLNPEHIDAANGKVRAWIEVNVTPQRGLGFDAIAERIYRFPEVKSCYLLSGGYDLLLMVECDSLHQVGAFVAEKLATQENVTRTATHFLLKIYKQDDDIFHGGDSSERLPVSP
ncbi:MAG: Lrp/AsnC family transcriptional regulator [bacterium]|nr:Lrp/AsnC family transcriptional regulator [bacterium]